MAIETTLQVFDPWDQPDENGDRLIHESVVQGVPDNDALTEALRRVVYAVDPEGDSARYPELVREAVRAMAIAYALGALDSNGESEYALTSLPATEPTA